jgi:hypothetical protein
MKLLRLQASDDEILALCREWVELVAAARLEEAIDLLYVPPTYDASQRWTADSLRTYIGNYGSWDPWEDGREWRITSLLTAAMPAGAADWRPGAEIGHLTNEPRSGWVDLDLPLNGEWSDLTAQFEFAPVEDGLGVSLYDLHVL